MIMQWILSSCVLLVAVALLGRSLGERISGKLRYTLWLVVLVRLLLPVQLLSCEAPTLAEETTTQLETAETGFVIPAERSAAEETDRTDPARLLGTVWIGGAVIVAGVFLATNLSFGSRLKRARVETGIVYRVPVYLIEDLNSPCLFGLLRPAIYVPAKAAEDRAMLHHMLAHECAHFGQGDHIWSVLRCVALSVHWWNPLVWWAMVLSKQDAELSCDEGALRDLWYDQRKPYGETLLRLVTAPVRPISILSCVTTMVTEKELLKQRIRRIANRKGYYRGVSVAAAVVMTLLAVCSFTGPAAYATGNIGGLDYELLGVLPCRPDLDHDGREEVLTLSCAETKTGSHSYLLEVRKDGGVLWSTTADTDRSGWNALFLTEVEGRDYLLDIDARMSDGECAYGYFLFCLNEYGGRQAYDREYLVFDVNFSSESHGSAQPFDPSAIAAVADKIDSYLADSYQLLNTDANLMAPHERGGAVVDDLWWLGELDGFTRDESLTLEEDLWAYFDLYAAPNTEKNLPSVRAEKVIEVLLTAPNPDLQYVIGGTGIENQRITRNWDTAVSRFIAWDNWQGSGKSYGSNMGRKVVYHQLNRFQVEAAASGAVYEVLDIELICRDEAKEELDVTYAVNGEERRVKMTFYGSPLFTRIDIEPQK